VSSESRYQVLPCGLGSFGVYDNQDRRWVRAYSGDAARRTADAKLRSLHLRQERPELTSTRGGRSR
jgi:hypothetical protein